jgi:hypothetical protein
MLGCEIDPTKVVVVGTVRSLNSNEVIASKRSISIALSPRVATFQHAPIGEVQHELEIQAHAIKVSIRDESTRSRVIGSEL